MRRLTAGPAEGRFSVDLEGEPVEARPGEPVACSLLAGGVRVFSRSVKYHRPRGPFCMTGDCGQCLMQVDGVPNVATCRVVAQPGMKLQRQNAFPSGDLDVFEAVDWLFPRGMDHHEMFAGVPVAETVMLHVARALAGLGLLPKDAPAPALPSESVSADAVVVGAGAAGSEAAHALAAAGRQVLVLEREAVIGGRLVSGAAEAGAPEVPALPSACVRLRTTVVGIFSDDGRRVVVAVQETDGGPVLLRISARAVVLAPGGHPALLPFENNDLPGIYAGRAVSSLVRRHGLLPGERVAVLGEGPELYALAALLRASGADIPLVLQLSGSLPADAGSEARIGTPTRASGLQHVKSLAFESGGDPHKVACDAVAVCLPPSPALSLAVQAGARTAWSEAWNCFHVVADEAGHTGVDGLYAAGDVTGPREVAAAAAHGRRAGEAVATWLARAAEVTP
jgi:sarcosine oxidase subunit alpha